MTDATTTPLKLTSLGDLVEVVPTLLGFHATESLVAIAIDEGHIVVTARVDLPGEGESIVPALQPVWQRFPRARLVLIAFSEDPDRAWGVLDELGDFLVLGGMAPLAALHADGVSWFDDPDAPGVPYDPLGNVHVARAAYEGHPVRASRDELTALIRPSWTPAQVTASLARMGERVGSTGDLIAQARALLAGHDDAPGVLDLDEVTVVALASQSSGFLDEALWSTERANAPRRRDFWVQVVRGTPPRCSGGALVALALASWVAGDGALQTICLEALEGVPAPLEWVDLLDVVNRDAVEPAWWDAARTARATG